MGAPRHTDVEIVPAARDVVSSATLLEAEAATTHCPVFPDPSVIIAFGGGSWKTDGGATIRGGGLRVLGVLTRPWSFGLRPGEWLVTVGLRAGAARAVLGVPASEITGGLFRLDDLWGARGRRLEGALEALGSTQAALRLLHELAASAERASQRRARWIDDLEASGGRAYVDDLARRTGVTRQQLRRQSRRDLGVSPKLAGRLMRFQGALAAAAAGGRRNWSEVAARLGYFDQAHLIAEFREFTGTSPTQLA